MLFRYANRLKLIICTIFMLNILMLNSQTPPKAKQIPKKLTKHKVTRIDNYYWLNQRENPEVIDYLNEENKYTDEMLKSTESLQNDLYDEIVGRIDETDMSVPYKSNGYWYYTRYEEKKEYPIFCRKKESLEAKEEIILDQNALAVGKEYFSIGGLSISEDNKLLAYSVDELSRRIYTIYIKNLETGKLYEDVISGTSGSITWANDNKTIFYDEKDEVTLRNFQIKKHILGSNREKDEVVFVEADETFDCSVFKTKSKQYIMIASGSTLSSEYLYLDANKPDGKFSAVLPREKKHEYSVSHYGDDFYIVTNWKADNFRLMKCKVGETDKKKWVEIIPHRKDVLLEDIEIFKDYLVVEERKNGLLNIRIIKWEDKSEHYLNFGEEAYTAYVSTNPEFDTQILRFGYTSLTTPSSTYDYDMQTKAKILLKEQKVLGNFDKNNYVCKRIYITARDGVKVPVSIVYNKKFTPDGTNAMLLYAYGSYGISMDPYFNSARLSLLDRGVTYAIAHIRGGEELGRSWYEDGKLLKKKNTFYDFIDCAKFLAKEKWADANKMFAMGGSAGGLLMGAVLNEEPLLFKGMIAAVPFVDVVTTMLDETIPLTTGEYDEWGNPNSKKYFDYMLSYSPYDNVEKKAYTNLLVTTGLHDSQVQYWEPAKWVAKLRELKTDNNLLLMKTNMDAGHGGSSGRFKAQKERALEYAFILHLIQK